MKRDSAFWWIIGLVGVAALTTVAGVVAMWKLAGKGQSWMPYLNAAEKQRDMPPDLLARVAYQESHFRDDIIRGVTASPAGALGLLQMMPQYFRSVNVPRPYTDTDVLNQITEAADYLVSLFSRFGSWDLALAAYNAGPGNVSKYDGIPPFPETQTYVADILNDVPVARESYG